MSELYRHSLGEEGGALRNSVTAITASVISWTPDSANAYHRSLERSDLWWISVPLFLVVCCLLMRPQIPHERYRQGGARIREIAQRRRHRAQRQHRQSLLRRLIRNDPTCQKEIVEYSLHLATVTRKYSAYMNVVTEGIDINDRALDPLDIEAGGAECDMHRAGSVGYISPASNVSSTADDPNSCMICLDPFRQGDVVAWSRVLANPAIANKVAISPDNKGDNVAPSDNLDFSTQPAEPANVPTEAPQELRCRHVFHHDCIVSWLLDTTHDDCPCCRTRILFYPPGLIKAVAAHEQSQQGAESLARGESDHCTENGENQLSNGNACGERELRSVAEAFTSARRFVVADGLVVARAGQMVTPSIDQRDSTYRSSGDIHSGCNCYDPLESSTTSLAPNSDSRGFHRQSFLTERGSPIFRSRQSDRDFSIFRSNSSDGVRMHTIRSHFRFTWRWQPQKNLLFENSGVDPLIEAPAAFEPRGFLSRTTSCGSGEARDPRLLAWAKTYSKLGSK
jgi:Zinc finger, C3HC4 type (RING finger)